MPKRLQKGKPERLVCLRFFRGGDVMKLGFFGRAIGLALSGLLAACSPVSVLNALVPSGGYQLTGDVAYGELPRHKLDVYRPVDVARDAPVVVFFYGGAWESGDRADYRFVGEALASIGVVAVIADYRIFPEVRFPDFLHDAAQAVSWTASNAQRFGGDPDKLFVMGHSAGAHIGIMLAVNPEYLGAVGMSPARLRGAIGLAGPYDFLPLDTERLKEIFGAETQWPISQPVNFVRGQEPPLLLATGDVDERVKPKNTVNLARRVREHGGVVREIHYPDFGHVKIVLGVAAPFRWSHPVMNDVKAFVEEFSAKSASSATLSAAGNPATAR